MTGKPNLLNLLPAAMVVLALLGLGVVQFQWLKAGIVVEKQAFDRELRLLLEETADAVARDPELIADALALHRFYKKGVTVPGTLQLRLRLKLEERVRTALESQQKNLPFSIALTESIWRKPLLVGGRFDWSEETAYRTYAHTLDGDLSEACYCQMFLHLQLRGFLPHLLQRLWWLLALTGLGLIFLLAGFALLVRKVRHEQRLALVKNDFINTLTHELKTPVFASSLLLKLLSETIGSNDDDKSQDYLRRLVSENDQLKARIERVLELASLEQPVYQLELDTVLVKSWLNGYCEAIIPKVEAQGGHLKWRCEGPDGYLRTDVPHLTNVLSNLLDNALKYGGKTPQIEVLTKATHNALRLEVRDHGPGIPEEMQGKVFQKFFRLHPAQVQGFGLGLSYVQQIVKLHGGAVSLYNHPDGGAVFELLLPGFEPGETGVSPQLQPND